MLKYVAKRLVYIVFTLWIIVTCTFYMMKNLPGTPFDAERFSIMTPAQKKQVLEMYGLNDPLPVQYVKYMKNIIHGDLGTSFTYVNKDVADVISGRLGPSALIGIQAVLLGLAVGLILGILAAWKHNSGIDYFTMILAVFCAELCGSGSFTVFYRIEMGNPSCRILDELGLLGTALNRPVLQCYGYGSEIHAYRDA